MSDQNDAPHRTPLSSSSSNPSGTQALGVTIEDDNREAEAAAVENTDARPEQSALPDAHQAANENERDSARQDIPPHGASDAAEETVEPLTQPADTGNPQPSAWTAPAEPPLETPSVADFAPQNGADKRATEDLRAAVRATLVQNQARQEQVLAMFDQVSVDFKSALEDARNDAARITFKLMEFAQANFRNNVELARDYASARSVPEIFNVQTAYFKRQMELVNRQADELRKLTAEIASKKAAQFPFHAGR